MGFGALITLGDDRVHLPDDLAQWLVEVRVEMELSRPTRFALRFEDDLCTGDFEVDGSAALEANEKIGVFVRSAGELVCLVFGPITEKKTSPVLGGAGSWVEIHGEDRRAEMGRVAVQATYTGRASDAAAQILGAYQFTPAGEQTLIQYEGTKNKLTQRGTDLAFIEDIARKNNMEFWLEYKVLEAPGATSVGLIETANLRTSPKRSQRGEVPQIPTLVAPAERALKVAPPGGECPTVNKFEGNVDFEKPAAARGFALSEKPDIGALEQLVEVAGGSVVKRERLPPPAATPEEAFLKKEALVYEQSWFVEAEGSTTLEQLQFVLLPHQVVDVSHAGERLSGAHQVMKTTHVVTATDHFIDFTLRSNRVGGLSA